MRLARWPMRAARRPLTAWLLLSVSVLLLAATIVSSFHAYGVDIEISTENGGASSISRLGMESFGSTPYRNA